MYGDRKVKCLKTLLLWVMDLMLRYEGIDLNYFNGDILAGAIE